MTLAGVAVAAPPAPARTDASPLASEAKRRTVAGPLTDSQIETLLHRENEARVSARVQALFAAAERSIYVDWMDVAAQLQVELLRGSGYVRCLPADDTDWDGGDGECCDNDEDESSGDGIGAAKAAHIVSTAASVDVPGNEALKAALHQYRAAGQTPRFAHIPLYVRHNRACRGKLRDGDEAPDVPLVPVTTADADAPTMSTTTAATTATTATPPAKTTTSLHDVVSARGTAAAAAAAPHFTAVVSGSYS